MGKLVSYNNHEYLLKDGESVLDGLLRGGNRMSYSCKSGVCQSCVLKMVNGKIPELAQSGLNDAFRAENFFLSCQCFPDTDIVVQKPSDSEVTRKVAIIEKSFFSQDVMLLRMLPETAFECKAGQYITITNENDVTRSFAIANNVEHDGYIEAHIKLLPNGKMGSWLLDVAQVGDELTVHGPAGYGFYIANSYKDYPIFLAGTDTGIGSLYGIILDALSNGHSGEIRLYHGVKEEDDLYMVDELDKMAEKIENFSYVPCVMHGKEGDFYKIGSLDNIVTHDISKLSDSYKNKLKIYLCGDAHIVNETRAKAFVAGVPPQNINVDLFLPSKD